jgi:hypothetical protein
MTFGTLSAGFDEKGTATRKPGPKRTGRCGEYIVLSPTDCSLYTATISSATTALESMPRWEAFSRKILLCCEEPWEIW